MKGFPDDKSRWIRKLEKLKSEPLGDLQEMENRMTDLIMRQKQIVDNLREQMEEKMEEKMDAKFSEYVLAQHQSSQVIFFIFFYFNRPDA